MQEVQCGDRHSRPEPFCFLFEGDRFQTDDREVTPPEIRRIVGDIASDVPIVLCLDDATQKTLAEDEETALAPCPNFRRLPRFKRG
jgi:hypothetical protein